MHPFVDEYAALQRSLRVVSRLCGLGAGRRSSAGKIIDDGPQDHLLVGQFLVVHWNGHEDSKHHDAAKSKVSVCADRIVPASYEHIAAFAGPQHYVVPAAYHERPVAERPCERAVADAGQPWRVAAVYRAGDFRERREASRPHRAAAERAEEHSAALRGEAHELSARPYGRKVAVVPSAGEEHHVNAIVRLRLFKHIRPAGYLLYLVARLPYRRLKRRQVFLGPYPDVCYSERLCLGGMHHCKCRRHRAHHYPHINPTSLLRHSVSSGGACARRPGRCIVS